MLTKVCTKCSLEKTVDFFSKKKDGKYGVRSYCKDCQSVSGKNYYSSNKDRVLLNQKAYAEINKEARSTYSKRYRKENSQKIQDYQRLHRSKHKERYKQYFKQYAKKYQHDNKSYFAAAAALRRFSKKQATPTWTDMDVVTSLYHIAAELTELGVPTHVDHIVPLNSDSVCGLHCESNMQLLSASDNISKGNRHWPDMW